MWYIWTAGTCLVDSLKPYVKRSAVSFGFQPLELQIWEVYAYALLIPLTFLIPSHLFKLTSKPITSYLFPILTALLSFGSGLFFNLALSCSVGPDVVMMFALLGITACNYVIGLITGYSELKVNKIIGCAGSILSFYVYSSS